MSVQAYILVDCASGKPFQIVRALRELTGVETVHAVSGAYDVIAFVRIESLAALRDLLTHRIQLLPGVVRTTTNVVVEHSPARRSTGSPPGQRA